MMANNTNSDSGETTASEMSSAALTIHTYATHLSICFHLRKGRLAKEVIGPREEMLFRWGSPLLFLVLSRGKCWVLDLPSGVYTGTLEQLHVISIFHITIRVGDRERGRERTSRSGAV